VFLKEKDIKFPYQFSQDTRNVRLWFTNDVESRIISLWAKVFRYWNSKM